MRRYRAYILADGADAGAARRIRRWLEAYKTPKALIGVGGRFGLIPDAVGPVLLDTSANPDDVNVSALRDSECLIVLCSRASAASDHVRETVLAAKRILTEDRILCVLLDGEPGAARILGRESEECMTPALRFHINSDGSLSDRAADPTAVDLRPNRGVWANARMRLAAMALGGEVAAIRAAMKSRGRRRSLAFAAAVAVAVAFLFGMGQMKVEKRRLAALAEMEAQIDAAHAALDAGRTREATLILDAALPDAKRLGNAPPGASAVLTRYMLEARLLADLPAPSSDVAELVLLPNGALASLEAGGRTYLVDPGVGAAVLVYDPVYANGPGVFTRISSDRRTLWTAHFEPIRQGSDGERFSPLIFEEVDLETGEVRLETAVKSVPVLDPSADISPDGANFAVDLGPGATEETLIAIFAREGQALVGTMRAPSDRAQVAFIDNETLLVAIDAPGETDAAPGRYLWRLGEDAPVVLNAPGVGPSCGDAPVAADAKALRAVVSGDRREVALVHFDAERGTCVERWSVASGERLGGALLTPASPDEDAEALMLAAGGPLILSDGADARYFSKTSSDALVRVLAGCGRGVVAPLEGPNGVEALYCAGDDRQALHFSLDGWEAWSAQTPIGGVRAHAYDAAARRLYTIDADARLRAWDAAPRFRRVDGASGEVGRPSNGICGSNTGFSGVEGVISADGRMAALLDPGSRSWTVLDAQTCGPLLTGVGAPADAEVSFSETRGAIFRTEAAGFVVDLDIDIAAARTSVARRAASFAATPAN